MIEEQVRTALVEEARSYAVPDALWDGIVSSIERAYWRRAPRRLVLVAITVAAAVAAAALFWPSSISHRLRVGPAHEVTTTVPPAPPPRPPGPLPSWAYPFLGTREGGREIFLVTEHEVKVVAGDGAAEASYGPLGLAGEHLVYLRQQHGDGPWESQLVVAPLQGGQEEAIDVTGASLSADRKRIAYITRDGRTPMELVVRDVLGGNERRLSLEGSQFAAPVLLFRPWLFDDVVVLEHVSERPADDGVWTLDLRRPLSIRGLDKWPEGTHGLSAYDGRHTIVVLRGKNVIADIRTRAVVQAVPENEDAYVMADGRGHVIAVGDAFYLYDGGRWLPVPGFRYAAW